MANVNSRNGFSLVRGSTDEQNFQRFHVSSAYATKVCPGDAVKLSGSANSDGVAQVTLAAAGDTNGLGVVVAVETPNWNDLTKNFIPASTGGYVLVCSDPRAQYIVQEDSVGGALVVADVGQLIDLVDAGSSTYGVSGMEIDSSTKGASGTFRVLSLLQRPDNEVGTNAKWVVTYAEHMDLGTIVAV